jgi:hypothetical protein
MKYICLLLLIGSLGFATTKPAVSPSSTYARLDTATVLICQNGNVNVYHRHVCQGLSRCTHPQVRLTMLEANQQGLRGCKWCFKY